MAYSAIENRYLSALASYQFPDPPAAPAMPEMAAPDQPPEDVLLAAGPSQTMTDAGGGGRPVDSIKPFDPTIRQRLADFLQAGFEGMGMNRYKARQNAQTLIGGPSSNLPLSIGLADVMPFLGTTMQSEEAAIMGGEAVESARQGNYGTAALQAGGAALGLLPGAAATAKAARPVARALAPKAGEMTGNMLQRQGLLIPAVPLERYGPVTRDSAARVNSGATRISRDVAPEKQLKLMPEYRVSVTGSYTPEGKNQNIVNDVNPGNYQDVSTRLDNLAVAFPDPLKSDEAFATMMANVYNSNEVPIPPSWLINNANDMQKWSSWFGSMSKAQIDEADRGFAVVNKFRNIYQNGTASADTTGTLMFWAMLSRMASAYPHESGFLDLAESMQPFIQKAVRGEFTQADIDAGLQMVGQTIPAGSPGKQVTSNANDFVSVFLPKMSEKLPDGRTKLQALHDMVANPEMTGPQIRREFYGLAEGVGIRNKVLSFALLVSGREDVMVLDRIQINRLFAGGDKIYDDVAFLFDGGPGLATYEALERSLATRVKDLYTAVGRPDKASIGRYHWESWVLSSGQEVAHPTLETIVKKAEGAPMPFANVPVREGRTHERGFGVTYERMPGGGNRFVYETANGDKVAMTKNDLNEMFDHVMEKKNGVIPDNFPGVKFFSKDTLPDGSPNQYFGKPWYTWPGVNRELIDDFASAIGTTLPAPGSAGAVPRAVQGGAADGSKRTGRQTRAGQQPGVTRGGAALQQGAE